jgi:hypothetical protein
MATIDLNELLQRIEVENTIPDKISSLEGGGATAATHETVGVLKLKPTPPKETKTRSIPHVCHDIVNMILDGGSSRVEELKEELRRKKDLALADKEGYSPLASSDPDLVELYETERKRAILTQQLADSCIAAVNKVQKNVGNVREKTKRTSSLSDKLVKTKRDAWNRKADQISKKHINIVTKNHKIVEKDWQRLLEANEGEKNLHALQGGGSAAQRLNFAKDLGCQPTDTCINRAKIYDKSRAVHEAVHWRLRDVVQNVTTDYANRAEEINRSNMERFVQGAVMEARNSLRQAESDYVVSDAPLKYEVDMLRQALRERNVPSRSVTHSILRDMERTDVQNRQRLARLL